MKPTTKYELWVNDKRVYVGGIETCKRMKALYLEDAKLTKTEVNPTIVKVTTHREVI